MAHYFAEHASKPLQVQQIEIRFKGKTYQWLTSGEVFSKTRFDPGSAILLESVLDIQTKTVLDLGCGSGMVGILYKKFHPTAEVFLSDINRNAVLLAKKNAALQRCQADIRQGNLFEPWNKQQFDCILLNPPQQAGRELCYQMIEQSSAHLTTKGK